MLPTLPVECDIEIFPLPPRIGLGALIVFVADDTLIAHRLVRRAGDLLIAQGDGRLGPDRPLAAEQVLGVVATAYRDGRRCWPGRFSQPLAALWVARHYALSVVRAGRRRLQRASGRQADGPDTCGATQHNV